MNVYEYVGTATTVEASQDVGITELEALCNDGNDDIIFGINADTASVQTRRVKPGEVYTPAKPLNVRTLYYKSASGSQSFRYWGVK